MQDELNRACDGCNAQHRRLHAHTMKQHLLQQLQSYRWEESEDQNGGEPDNHSRSVISDEVVEGGLTDLEHTQTENGLANHSDLSNPTSDLNKLTGQTKLADIPGLALSEDMVDIPTRPSKTTLSHKTLRKQRRRKAVSLTETTAGPDLAPMISDSLRLLFIGFNPGVQSAQMQHHYAHPSNLFWKLFNQLALLPQVAQAQGILDHPLVLELFQDGKGLASFRDDARLVDVGIGFTDLVLRCTRAAHHLSPSEKTANVPRVMREVRLSNASHVVVVGKGVWETFVRAFTGDKIRHFVWGLQTDATANAFYRQCGRRLQVYVVPSTSGLVALMTFGEKLALWVEIARSVSEDVK